MYGVNWFLILCMCVALAACVASESDMEEYVAQVKRTAKGKLAPIPPPAQIKSAQYTAENLRSPFVLTGGSYSNAPTVATGPNGEIIQQKPRPDLSRPREYLEQFPLAGLNMVGILSKSGLSWGLVKDVNGMIHAVKVGDYLGQNSGKIVAITPDQIKLIELIPNGAGGWMRSKASLTLVQTPTTEEQQPTAVKGKVPQKTGAGGKK